MVNKKFRGKTYEKCSNKDCVTNKKTKPKIQKKTNTSTNTKKKSVKTLKAKAEIESIDE